MALATPTLRIQLRSAPNQTIQAVATINALKIPSDGDVESLSTSATALNRQFTVARAARQTNCAPLRSCISKVATPLASEEIHHMS